MEYIDIYDENEKFLRKCSRKEAHEKGYWHKTTHCWILRKDGKILFQMRSKKLKDNPGKLYTTASGHVSAGETLKDALHREVNEECGINIDTNPSVLFEKGRFKVDFLKTNGAEYHDRALYNMFFLENNTKLVDFDFQKEELEGIYELSIQDTLDFLKGEKKELKGTAVFKRCGKTYLKEMEINLDQFQFANQGTGYEKFGTILEKALDFFTK